ncbi:MAG: cellulase family glycosylhydrolase, partial [Acidobacteriaceae bacterium]|nr:cellulase family glycosylhydrolase [Acidobacteriaceae bacterium]
GTSGGGYPSSSSCSTQSIISWIDDVAPYVKSVDPNHMVAVGDEGFFCDPSTTDWITNCSQGVDTIAFSSAPGIDAMGFHLYPEGWGRTTAWADTYINQHIADAGELGKPAYLGEFGLMAGNLRNSIYKDWTDRFLDNRASGALFWDLAVGQPGANSAESDGSFDIKEAAPLLNTIHNFSEEITANTNLPFAPVADDAWATTPFNQSTTLTPLGNDVAYAGATIDPNSIDLDPNTPGRQTSVSVYGGQFQVVGQGVQFTPTAGFNGASQAPYTIEDSNHKLSNVAFLNVTVKPSEGAVLILESFETGTDGWGPINASAGTVSQSTAFHTDGTHSLQVNATGGGWFGVTFASPLDLSGRPSVSIDIESTTIGGGTAIAFQSGSAYTWCQTPDPWPTLPSNGVTTLKLALVANQLNCGGGTPDLTDIHTIFVYLNGPGTFYLDYLRAAAPVISSTPVEIQSFETGTGGWNALHSGDGSVAQESSFHTDGNYGLEINSTSSGGDWFGLNLPSALDLSGKTSIKFDIQTLAQGTSSNVAIQTGANWTWCQGGAWPYTSAGNTTTVAVDFSSLVDTSNNPCNPTLSQIHALWIFFNNGTFNLDNVRAQ